MHTKKHWTQNKLHYTIAILNHEKTFAVRLQKDYRNMRRINTNLPQRNN